MYMYNVFIEHYVCNFNIQKFDNDSHKNTSGGYIVLVITHGVCLSIRLHWFPQHNSERNHVFDFKLVCDLPIKI